MACSSETTVIESRGRIIKFTFEALGTELDAWALAVCPARS